MIVGLDSWFLSTIIWLPTTGFYLVGVFLRTGFHGAAADLNRVNHTENESASPQTAERCVVLQLKDSSFGVPPFRCWKFYHCCSI